MNPPVYAIRWSTDTANGELPIAYISLEAALVGARQWEKEMVAQEKASPKPSVEYRTEVYRLR